MQNEEMSAPADIIAQYSDELELGPIGLWHVVPRVTNSANGQVAVSDLRQIIMAMLEAGAVPVRHIPGSGYEWVHQKQYGSSPEEIANAIVKEWEPVPNTSQDMIEHCPWFALPDPAFPKYLKMD